MIKTKTYPEKESPDINTFMIEKNWSGVKVGAKENKLKIPGSDTHSISFTDLKVPNEKRIGEDGSGISLRCKRFSVAALVAPPRH